MPPAAVRGKVERAYHEAVQPEILRAMIELYSSSETRLAYSSHEPNGIRHEDQGFGFHVVKRLALPGRTIWVNEAWTVDGRVGLPDEIRVRIQMAPEAIEKIPGAADVDPNFLLARYRVAWDFNDTPHLYEEPQHGEADGKMVPRIAPVSVFSCRACHRAGNTFTLKFLPPGATVGPDESETIVKKAFFDLPLAQAPAYVSLIKELESLNPNPKFIARAQQELLEDSKRVMSLPGILPALRDKLARGTTSPLGLDPLVVPADPTAKAEERERQWSLHYRGMPGYYRKAGAIYRDALVDTLETRFGKYQFWTDNNQLIPSLAGAP